MSVPLSSSPLEAILAANSHNLGLNCLLIVEMMVANWDFWPFIVAFICSIW